MGFSNYSAVFKFLFCFKLYSEAGSLYCVLFSGGLCFILVVYLNTLETITYLKTEIIYTP